MYPKPIEDYFAPPTVDAAVELLDRHGADGKLLVGGQSLLPLLKGRFVETRFIVDLNQIPELAGLGQLSANGRKLLRIGAISRASCYVAGAPAGRSGGADAPWPGFVT